MPCASALPKPVVQIPVCRPVGMDLLDLQPARWSLTGEPHHKPLTLITYCLAWQVNGLGPCGASPCGTPGNGFRLSVCPAVTRPVLPSDVYFILIFSCSLKLGRRPERTVQAPGGAVIRG